METYATPFDRAKSLVEELSDFAAAHDHELPVKRYATVGDVIRDCESVIVAVNGLTPDPNYDPVTCVSPRTATFLVNIIRSCAVTFDREGTTDPEATEEVSQAAAADGNLLYEFAEQLFGWSSKAPWSVVFSLAEGGLSVSELQITIGVP